MGEECDRWRPVRVKRLYLTVEGQTEQAFAVDVLQPHLTQFNVMLLKPRLTGLHARRRGRIPTGGLLNSFRHSLGDIKRWLLEDKSTDARFSMMVDLYSLPNDFPGYENVAGLTDPHRQAQTLESALASEICDRRFIPYLQVHEFEALVLSRPIAFGKWFDNAEMQVQCLTEVCRGFESPEKINHGRDSHPKALIESCFCDYDDNVDGPALAADIGLGTIRSACPHFHQWLAILESLDVET